MRKALNVVFVLLSITVLMYVAGVNVSEARTDRGVVHTDVAVSGVKELGTKRI
ncbi:MAG: hypothetical protein OXL41_15595 [Nitrospinae bacterium]|nr:hypothetical protein [Nitrospinota bacterium]